MSAERWPCSACGEPGYRNVAARGYCRRHFAALLATFDPAVFEMRGFGVQAGPPRPDHGAGFMELECVVCGAGWVGELLDPCPWCMASLERMARWQAERLLDPDLPDPDDRRFDGARRAWAERLARGVEVGLITERQARRAWARRFADAA